MLFDSWGRLDRASRSVMFRFTSFHFKVPHGKIHAWNFGLSQRIMNSHVEISKIMFLSIPTLEFVQALFKFHQFPIQILPKIFPKWIWIIPKLVPKRTKIDAKCWRSIQERPRGAQLVAKSSQEALFAQSWLQLGFRNLPKWRASRKKIDVKKQVDFDLIFSSFPLRLGAFSEGLLMQNYIATTKRTYYWNP